MNREGVSSKADAAPHRDGLVAAAPLPCRCCRRRCARGARCCIRHRERPRVDQPTKFAATVLEVVDDPGAGPLLAAIRNCDQAGALKVIRPEVPVHGRATTAGAGGAAGGHDGDVPWGPPASTLVGSSPLGRRHHRVRAPPRSMTGFRPVVRADEDAGVDNEERGKAVLMCSRPWSELWPHVRHLSA